MTQSTFASPIAETSKRPWQPTKKRGCVKAGTQIGRNGFLKALKIFWIPSWHETKDTEGFHSAGHMSFEAGGIVPRQQMAARPFY